ncbi:alpha/beta fold hydrolase [Agaribacterium sp. ZY112]|uniref:alpha/beta fold hydrolase n=1 Tax=Agaribacterium sp. ZY112 TaxID=3233574 RepID=UPI003525C772
MSQAQEEVFKLDAITLAALRWNKSAEVHVLALHGWLDNANSFSVLAPLLTQCDVVALDMAGHGLSQSRPGCGAYNIWQDIRELVQVLDQLNWSSCYILGHSRGAMIASLLAASFPERIQGLILIDAILPYTETEQNFPKRLREATLSSLDSRRLNRRSYYPEKALALKSRSHAYFPIPISASALFAERSLKYCPDKGWYWQYDSRLNLVSELRLTVKQAEAVLSAFPQKALVLCATEGLLKRPLCRELELSDHLDLHTVEGPHHVHLSECTQKLALVAELVLSYISHD